MIIPQITCCLICDGVRQETQNKYIILGFFGATPHVEIFVRDFKLTVPLCFLFLGTQSEGHLRLELSVKGPSGQLVANSIAPFEADMRPNIQATLLIFYFSGVFPGPGKYQVSAMINGMEHYPTSFTLSQAAPAAV